MSEDIKTMFADVLKEHGMKLWDQCTELCAQAAEFEGSPAAAARIRRLSYAVTPAPAASQQEGEG